MAASDPFPNMGEKIFKVTHMQGHPGPVEQLDLENTVENLVDASGNLE